MERWNVDPTWTAEEAFKQEVEWFTAGRPDGRARGPFEGWRSLVKLAELEKRFAAGENGVILDAVSLCALDDLVMPEWLARAFLKQYRKVRHYHEKSWDGAFGKPHKKGTHLAAERKRQRLAIQIWNKAVDILRNDPSRPIDAELYGQAGRDLGVEKTLAQEYIAWWSKLTGWSLTAYRKY